MKKKIVYLALALTLVLSTAAALVSGMAGTGSAGLAQAEEGPAQPDAATEAGVEEALMKLPLYFIENQGQMDERVAYYVQGSNMSLYFTAQGVTFVLRGSGEEADSRQQYALKLEFVGANHDVQPVGKDRTEAIISYFKGSPEEWKTGLPTYTGIAYPDLWPGIDLVYSGDASRLKYAFLVQPGIDPGRIKLAYEGASAVTLNGDGQLEVSTPAGGFQDDRPVAYQDAGGHRVPVEASYALDEEVQSYGFEVGSYDPSELLVIDPAVLVYCGYIGGSDGDFGFGIAVDGSGCAYVTGHTLSDETPEGFPVTVGPYLTFNGGSWDAFVAKVKANPDDTTPENNFSKTFSFV
ncbi:SBBP repeat-containing protein [Chloroflexota bacterium]